MASSKGLIPPEPLQTGQEIGFSVKLTYLSKDSMHQNPYIVKLCVSARHIKFRGKFGVVVI
jgi:hypothetical protein